MATAEELRRASAAVSSLLVAIGECRRTAELLQRPDMNRDYYGKRLVANLYDVEAECRAAEDVVTAEYAELFAAVNGQPVAIGGEVEASAHALILGIGAQYRYVALATVRAARPRLYEQPGEYVAPNEFAREDELLPHIGAAAKSVLEHFPAYEDLNRIGALLDQEVSRAVLHCRSTANNEREQK